jgi:hypothetical protein
MVVNLLIIQLLTKKVGPFSVENAKENPEKRRPENQRNRQRKRENPERSFWDYSNKIIKKVA